MVAIVMGDDKCEFLESDWRGPNFDWAPNPFGLRPLVKIPFIREDVSPLGASRTIEVEFKKQKQIEIQFVIVSIKILQIKNDQAKELTSHSIL
jgi:hypothetical protein